MHFQVTASSDDNENTADAHQEFNEGTVLIYISIIFTIAMVLPALDHDHVVISLCSFLPAYFPRVSPRVLRHSLKVP